MTTSASLSDPPHPPAVPERLHLWPMVLLGFALALGLCWPAVRETWDTGNFGDTDDAMRMVQVRDWLAGQGWYDLTAWRLDPPAGSFMHWSRLVDLPIAALMRLFSLWLTPETAERLARIVYPLGLQLALLAVIAAIGRLLAGPRAGACAVWLLVLSGFMIGQFVPGRVDHESMQILLLMGMIGCQLVAFDPARWHMAVAAAGLLALSLAVSLENLPFIIIACATPTVAWIFRGGAEVRALRGFALGLLIALPVTFVIFNGPAHWFVAACDAGSIVHVVAGLIGALACLGLAAVTSWCRTWQWRASAVMLAGISVLVPVILMFPKCLGDPFVGLDPLVREIWLKNTTEVRPLAEVLSLHPKIWPMLVLPPLLGIAGMIAAALTTRGVTRDRWIALLAQAVAGCASTAWAIRADTSLAPIALLGGAFFCTALWNRLRQPAGALAAGAALIAALPFSPLFWAGIEPEDDNLVEEAQMASDARCHAASAYAPLASLPPGLVAAPLDAGAHLLAHTAHQVLAAPYHRNNHGNRLAIDIFLSPPDAARELVRQSHATYLAICPGARQLDVMRRRAPGGLGDQLTQGAAPDWLTPLSVAGTPFRIFRVALP